VLSLLTALEGAAPLRSAMPEALHRYLAEELFQSASEDLRENLLSLALLPRLVSELLASEFGERRSHIVDQAHRLGFIAGDDETELHPLLREFLLSKLLEEPNAKARVRAAITSSISAEEWEHALSLVLRFNLNDLVDPVLAAAFTPLARQGLVGTLSAFASQVRLAPGFPPAMVDLVNAEVAMREGQLELAIDLAGRAERRLDKAHPLRCRANVIIGQCHFLLASYDDAEAAYATARANATDGRDAAEANHGLMQTRVFGERGDIVPAFTALFEQRYESPTHLLRYATAELNRRRFDEGLGLPFGLDEALHVLPSVDDPRARTSFTYSLAYAFALRADYEEAERFLELFQEDIRSFDLEFAVPYANWTASMIALGLRQFGEAEKSLQAVEDLAKRQHEERHGVNARSLRARMLLQTGQTNEALQQVQPDVSIRLIPSWLGEYVATRALALACLKKTKEAYTAADQAVGISRAAEVKMLASSARAICAANANESSSAVTLVTQASDLSVWDPVVCALRSSHALADALAAEESLRPTTEFLYQRSRDRALARRAGFRTRSPHSPDELLSQREREVLGLIARGLRNHEISNALFIADSTTKVHVLHILEKLGVRTRAEAVARYGMFAASKGDASGWPNTT